jgi:hypothetical protein
VTALTPEQYQQLQRALMSAFPKPFDLEKMVRFGLDENLYAIAARGSLSNLVFDLITWAEAGGRTEELVKGALKEQRRNPELQSFAAALGWVAPATPVATLGTPASGKPGILIDLSHNQSEWNRRSNSIFTAARGQLAQILRPPPQESPWDLREIGDRRQLNVEELKAWSGLLMGIPFHERIEDLTRYEIAKWVRQGGRLVLLGFELGERHHKTNLNELAGEFGLRFNSDIAVPSDWQQTWRPYDRPIDFMQVQSDHRVMNGVSQLRLYNLCTLTVEPGADILLTLGPNGVGWLQKEGVIYTSQGWLEDPRHVVDIHADASWVPVIAEAPKGLTDQGSVLAIGTWELSERGYDFPSGFDNLRFVTNLLDWLGGRI